MLAACFLKITMNTENLKKYVTQVIGDVIAPIFIPMGFQNVNLNFARDCNKVSQVFRFNYQNTSSKATLTFFFGFYSYEVAKHLLGEYDIFSPTVKNNVAFFGFKIRQYEIDDSVDFLQVLEDLNINLLTYVKPIFEQHISFDDSKDYFLSNEDAFLLHPYTKAVYLLVVGERLEGVKELKKIYNQYVIPEKEYELNLADLNFYKDVHRRAQITSAYPYYFYVYNIQRIANEFQITL